jgi:hypothetical protein
MIETVLVLISFGAMGFAGWLMLYHVMCVHRKTRHFRITAPKPPNVLPENLPKAPYRATWASYLEAPPTIEEQDKLDWDARYRAWERERALKATETIDANDPELYEILERAATKRQYHG